MTMLPLNQEWTALALCAQVDPDLFYPEKGGSTRDAKAVCKKCPVQRECLDYALALESGELGTHTSYPSGIFGGLSERERRVLRKERQQLAATGTDGPLVAEAVEDKEEPAPRQYGLPYVGGANGGSHYPLPNPDRYVKVEQRGNAKPSIDWDQLRAQHEARRATEDAPTTPEPAAAVQERCRWCRKPTAELVDDLCPGCRYDADTKFRAPETTPHIDDLDVDVDDDARPTSLTEALAELERDEEDHTMTTTADAAPQTTPVGVGGVNATSAAVTYSGSGGAKDAHKAESHLSSAGGPAIEAPHTPDGSPCAPDTHHPLVEDEDGAPYPDYAQQIAHLMVTTEGHPDPTVKTARKTVANALVGLNKALRQVGQLDEGARNRAVLEAALVAGEKRGGCRGGARPRTDKVRQTAGNGVKAVTARLADMGVTAAQVRAWAREHGHKVPSRGAVPGRLVDAYEQHLIRTTKTAS